MNYYDEQLHLLHAQCARKKKLEASLLELRRQHHVLAGRVAELEHAMANVQADVDQLEGRSLTAFFYHVIGKRDEKLTAERWKAYAARVEYDAAARELAGVEAELRQWEAELASLQNCESRYKALFQEKVRAVKAQGGPTAEEILQLENAIAHLDFQKKELQEAIAAGNTALASAEEILASLDSAEGWGTWDLLGGGLVADLAKHSRLDAAQEAVESLQSQLRSFQTELADVTIDADLQVRINGFLRFADYFFDGLFADWAVLDHIRQSQEQIQATGNQICAVLQRLQVMEDDTEEKQAEYRNKIASLVHSVQM